MSLPAGWTVRIAPDGRVYYQNDITLQTQWNPPTVQQIQPLETYNNTHNNNTDNGKTTKRKIWDKEHIIWLVFLIVTFYDLFTDIQVASAWTNLESLCPQFKCHTLIYEILPMEYAAILMYAFSMVGFVAALIFKVYEARWLYMVYKNPMSDKQLRKTNLLINYKRTMLYGWIPSIVEDAVSVLLIIIALSQGVVHYVGLSGKYTRSLLTSIISASAGTLYGFFKYRKFSDVILDEEEVFAIEKARYCHKCWCCYLMVMISFMAFIAMGYVLVVFELDANTPLIELKPDNSKCEYFGYSGAANESYSGEITKVPQEIFAGCLGSDYDYHLKCIPDRSDEFAYCTLKWGNYDGNNTIDCDNSLDNKCEFNLYVGVCGDYTIICNNSFQFAHGNPVMYACIDYCDA